MRRAIKSLGDDPRLAHTKALDFHLTGAEPRRLRLGNWRIVYAVVETDLQLVARVIPSKNCCKIYMRQSRVVFP
ncbi:MAG: type II toxin-antitoxin system RelE family toxin [Anaerolineae bacterium]